ncbi:MAG: hypothetical protein EOP52_13545 [Sphingobacteriales bacterium]|nr:MAG: hypothetical protein EOP52_13545 [Sphingobacteriales bacterium]
MSSKSHSTSNNMISTKGMDYGMISYFIYDRDIHPVEQSIVNAIRKISLYKNHLQSTTKLYGSEYSQQLDQLVITEKIQITEANERITQILAGAEQTEENRLYAEHMSGYDTIIFGYVDAKEELYNNFNEMVGYFNKSALVSSYSLLESELRRLCIILQETTNEKLSLKDISGSDYFGSMIKYLSLVIDIDTNKLEHYISKIRDLQKLRNKIVHSNGELISNTEDKESRVNLLRIINQNKGTLSLKIDSETQIETIQIDNSNYIAKYYSIFNAFFSRTLWCIDKRLDHSFLISRFTYLLNSIILQYYFFYHVTISFLHLRY